MKPREMERHEAGSAGKHVVPKDIPKKCRENGPRNGLVSF